MRYGDLEGPGARGAENQLELSLGEWGEREPNDDHEHAVMHGTDADDAQPAVTRWRTTLATRPGGAAAGEKPNVEWSATTGGSPN